MIQNNIQSLQAQGAIRQIMVMNNIKTISINRFSEVYGDYSYGELNSIRLDLKGGIKVYLNSKNKYRGEELKEPNWIYLLQVTQDIINKTTNLCSLEKRNILVPITR